MVSSHAYNLSLMGMIVMTFVCLFILRLLPFPSRSIFPWLVNHMLGKTALLSQALTCVICRSVYRKVFCLAGDKAIFMHVSV